MPIKYPSPPLHRYHFVVPRPHAHQKPEVIGGNPSRQLQSYDQCYYQKPACAKRDITVHPSCIVQECHFFQQKGSLLRHHAVGIFTWYIASSSFQQALGTRVFRPVIPPLKEEALDLAASGCVSALGGPVSRKIGSPR